MVKPTSPQEAPPAADPAKPLDEPELVTANGLAPEETGTTARPISKPQNLPEAPPPFPESKTLTRKTLQARFNKKVKGNLYLTAEEVC